MDMYEAQDTKGSSSREALKAHNTDMSDKAYVYALKLWKRQKVNIYNIKLYERHKT
jgi:hypothetical protein